MSDAESVQSEPKPAEKSATVELPRGVVPATRALATLAPRLTGRLFLHLFLRPPRFRVPDRERAWLAGAEPLSWRLDGRRIAGWTVGEGPTILLVHGWAGRGSQLGAFVGPLVERGFRVVGWDLPGHGASDGRRSSLPESAWATRALLDRLAPVTGIVAHSMGGAAVVAALDAGATAGHLAFLSVPDDVGYLTLRTSRAMGLPDRLFHEFMRAAERKFRIRFDDFVVSSNAPRRREPLIALHDTDDREVPVEHARRWAEAWPGARLEVSTGLGHTRILRDPRVVQRVVEHLAAASAGTAAEARATG